MKPKALTEEWLVRFGAEKQTHVNAFFLAPYFAFENHGSVGFRIEDEPHFAQFYCIAHCEYVHQIQNLYFALTGEELTLKS